MLKIVCFYNIFSDINITDNEGQTPLHAAVEGSSLEAIGCLIEW